MNELWVVALTGSVVILVGILLARVVSLQRRLGMAAAQLRALEQEAQPLRRDLARLDKKQEFVSRTLKQLQYLSNELHGRLKPRHIPGILLTLVERIFEPTQAVVLHSRKPAGPEHTEVGSLVIAAVSVSSPRLHGGMVIPTEDSEFGFVANLQQAMSRSDLQKESVFTQRQLRRNNLPGFMPDLLAPMVFSEECLGVIALTWDGPHTEEAKEVLRLIAQMGALTYYNSAAFSQLKRTADVDGLTQIFNKRYLQHTLGNEIFEAEQRSSKVSIFLFDVDNFKSYNDLNGHVAGDEFLRSLAQLVPTLIRDDDVFGRFGGEEFLVILPETGGEQALVAAEKIRSAIAGHDFPHAASQPLGIASISGGVACYPDDGDGTAALLRAADESLYRAKEQGRNRVLPATPRHLWKQG